MRIVEAINQSIEVKQKILSDVRLLEEIRNVARICTEAFCNGNKVLFCGNGGSAADAQHLAAEFSGRFYYDRPPLPSEALHVNTSYLTAVANDYSFDEVYSRLLRGIGQEGDVLIGISTSGNSKNIIRALQKANEMGIITIGMTGMTGGAMRNQCDYLLNVPSKDTPRIQESHIMIGHIICELVESTLFPKEG
ncbi:MAG: D-sedoheptulose 7-phosphate isomerase [Bacteroidales bacterium]|jgi:D-sedoheptulose 7-phosphate isomerase|nr:D-sedoheptulose 7-phosphate isomerase [Bacteroidales bacterium]